MSGVYYSDISFLYDENVFEEYLEELPDFRKEAALRCKRQADRARSAGAFLLLKRALTISGIDIREPQFLYGENKKPFLKGYGDIYFNLSHSGDLVMCIIGDTECGCDVQQIEKYDKNISARFFSRREHEYIMSLEKEKQAEAFYRLWALKESCIKADGRGMAMELSSFCVSLLEGRVDIDGCFVREYPCAEGYALAACCKGSLPPVQITDLSKEIRL